MSIKIQLPAVTLGVVDADGVSVGPSNEALVRWMDEVCEQKRHQCDTASLAESEPVRTVRAMFRKWGVDPSKYRPSSEALLRRVVQGKGFYRVSNLVDLGNVASVQTGWPFGCYDRARIADTITFRHGAPGEKYEGIGKRVWHLEGRPVLADAEGPFGSPISDSTRSMITESARAVLLVIYAPSEAPDALLADALAKLCEQLAEFAGAGATRVEICRPEYG
jgi:DNA/RNA-binding domain of Phe-tRNA-synthetase-like protein